MKSFPLQRKQKYHRGLNMTFPFAPDCIMQTIRIILNLKRTRLPASYEGDFCPNPRPDSEPHPVPFVESRLPWQMQEDEEVSKELKKKRKKQAGFLFGRDRCERLAKEALSVFLKRKQPFAFLPYATIDGFSCRRRFICESSSRASLVSSRFANLNDTVHSFLLSPSNTSKTRISASDWKTGGRFRQTVITSSGHDN